MPEPTAPFPHIRIETLGAMRVACFASASLEPETEGRSYLNAWLERQHLAGPARHFGFDIDVTQQQKETGLRGYEVWSSVPEGAQACAGVRIRAFPGGLYATLALEDPFADPFVAIPAAWKTLHEWVISNDSYRGANHQWLEEVIPTRAGLGLKLFYPVTTSAPAERAGRT